MKNVVVIAGGDSSEFEVSIKSSDFIFSSLDETRYNKYMLILRGREWNVVIDGKQFPVDKNDFSFLSEGGERICFDYAYIAIHGTPGENGLLQGYLDMMGIPYSTCSVLCSALTFDKYSCNNYLRGFGVNVAPSVLLRRGDTYSEQEIIEEIGIPCFVKPNAEGSSFGISKVMEKSQLSKALELAFKHGNEVLVEQFIAGGEFTCGVVKLADETILMPVAEIIPKNSFFDFEAKYDPTMSDEIIPARISGELTSRIQQLSSAIYDLLRCEGIIRVDYIVSNDEIFMLEVNTTPGMTSNSFIPKMVRAMGRDIGKFLTSIIESKIN